MIQKTICASVTRSSCPSSIQSAGPGCDAWGGTQAVAPVRETAAQAVGAAASALSTSSLLVLAGLLRQLCESSEWAVRQSGLLGLKYLLASRPDNALLEAVMPAIMQGLSVRTFLHLQASSGHCTKASIWPNLSLLIVMPQEDLNQKLTASCLHWVQ